MKAYHTKEQVIIKLRKDEYRQTKNKFKALQKECEILKKENKELSISNLKLSKELCHSCLSEIEHIRKINSLEKDFIQLKDKVCL